MFLTLPTAAILIAFKLLVGILAGMAVALILQMWRPLGKHSVAAGGGLGVAGTLAGSLLTGLASERTEYLNGHPVTWRTWFAAHETSFSLLLVVCLVGARHL
jgi:hypothetical protein